MYWICIDGLYKFSLIAWDRRQTQQNYTKKNTAVNYIRNISYLYTQSKTNIAFVSLEKSHQRKMY